MSHNETVESAIRYIRANDAFSPHAEKHTRRLMVSLKEVIKIYEKVIVKHKGHNWYPHNPESRAAMEEGAKVLIKERKKVVRAAKRLLELIA